MRHFFLGLLVIFTCFGAMDARAATLDEWPLPPGTSVGAIDVTHGTPVYLAESPWPFIDAFDPMTGQFIQWHPVPYMLSQPGAIRTGAAGGPVYVTMDMPPRLGRLDTGTLAFDTWDVMPAGTTTPHALTIDDVNGDVWFTAYDGISQPTLARFQPAMNMFTVWPLSSVATASDRVDGLDLVHFPSGDVFVYVTADTSQNVIELDVTSGRFRAWNLPILQASHVAVSGAREVWLVRGGASPDVYRIDANTYAGTLVETRSDPVDVYVSPEICLADGVIPQIQARTPSNMPQAAQVDPPGWPSSIAMVADPTFPAPSSSVVVAPGSTTTATLWSVSFLAPMTSFPPTMFAGAFRHWNAPSDGPLSCDRASPPLDTWFIEGQVGRLARLTQ